ncbi:MAG: hypothetical protein LBK95_08830 [Bifidobacteriaceae bacterium]|nr:hypothetical protein [Bifidobacteriaceae bacterium]
MSGFDLARRPVGLRAWGEFVDWVLSDDGLGESDWLEFKSDIQLPSKEGWSAVARFVLGAANRLPEHAAAHLDGAAVALVGIGDDGHPSGAARVDPADAQQGLEKYLGESGPRWALHWIARDQGDSGVLVFEVDSPEPGRIHVCKASGQKARSGAVYVRRNGKTEEANHEEMAERLKRFGQAPQDPEIVVEVLGTAYQLPDLDVFNSRHIRKERDKFLAHHAPQPKSPWSVMDLGMLSGRLPPKEAAAFIAKWQEDRRQDWPERRELLIGALGDGIKIRASSGPGTAPLEKPQIVLTFHGTQGFYWEDPADDFWNRAFPVPRDPTELGSVVLDHSPHYSAPPSRPDTDWRNGNAEALLVTVKPEALRPGQPWESDDDELVVAAVDTAADAVEVEWTATFIGVQGSIAGKLLLPVRQLPVAFKNPAGPP